MSQMFLDVLAKADPTTVNQANILLDTNVMLEVCTIADLLREVEKSKDYSAPTYVYRRLRARHSTLVAWWLGKQGRLAGLLGNEFADKLEVLAPDVAAGEDGTSIVFAAAIAIVVVPLVMRLRAGPLTDVNHGVKGSKADTEILTHAAGAKIPLITHEGLTEAGINDAPKKLRARALAAGVRVFTAEEYLAAERVQLDDECRRFIEACEQGVREAKVQNILSGHDVLDELVPLYRHILLGEVPVWSR